MASTVKKVNINNAAPSKSHGSQNPSTPNRKRSNSHSDSEESSESKKLKTLQSMNNEQLKIPNMSESEVFLFTAIQNLASNMTISFNNLNERMNQIETNLEAKLVNKIDTLIDTKVKDEVSKVKNDIQTDINTMNEKIEQVQKNIENITNDKETNAQTKNNIVIRNLEYDAREENNRQVTLNKVQSLFKDGLDLSDVKIKSVSRKRAKENTTGIIIVELENFAHKKNIFSKKKQLKSKPKYKKVYIDNDLPIETRIHQSNMRALLKEVGKDQKMTFIGNRLVNKRQ